MPALTAPVPPSRAALVTDVSRLRLLAALYTDVGRLRLLAALFTDVERRLADEARAGSNVAGDFSTGARAEREVFSEGERRECAARTHDERMRFGRAIENHARSIGVGGARRDERQPAIQHGHEH